MDSYPAKAGSGAGAKPDKHSAGSNFESSYTLKNSAAKDSTAYRCQAANKPFQTGRRKPSFQENPEHTSKPQSPALIWCPTAPVGKQGARISFHTSGQTEQT